MTKYRNIVNNALEPIRMRGKYTSIDEAEDVIKATLCRTRK